MDVVAEENMSKAAADLQTGVNLPGGYINTSDFDRLQSAKNSAKGFLQSSPPVSYENTYRVEPLEKFPANKLSSSIAEILEANLQTVKYDKELCGRLSRTIADKIRENAKSMSECNRYKVVTFVVIGEKGNATVALASRCVWNDKFDTRAEATYSNKHVYAVGVAYGLYHE